MNALIIKFTRFVLNLSKKLKNKKSNKKQNFNKKRNNLKLNKIGIKM